MANEFKHGTVGTSLSQAEWEGIGTHVVANQAVGDIIYADTTSQLLRLGIGSTNDVLTVASGKPSWAAPAAAAAGSLTGSTLASGVVTTSVTTVGALNAGSITSGFGNIDVGASSIAAGSFDASDGNITNVGDIALDTISSDAGTTVSVTLGTDAGDDFIAGNNSTLVVTGDNDRVGIGDAAPSHALHVAENGEEVARFQQTNTGAGHNHYTIFENDGGGDTFLSFLQASAQGYIGYTDANELKLLTDGFNARLTIDATSADFSVPINVQGGYTNGGGAPYDGVVDAGGGGNWTTLQAGDDALDAATNTVMLVKAGTYSTLTVDTNNVKIVCEPGTIATGAITLSGDNITLMLATGCDMRGLITLSGDNCSLLCENGVDLEGVTSSGNYNMIDGGGWDTISYVASAQSAILLSGAIVGNTVQNISAHTPTASNWPAMSLAGDYHSVLHCKVIYGGEDGIDMNAGSEYNVIANCVVLDCDAKGMMSNGPTNRIIGNYIKSAGTYGVDITDGGDNTVVIGNIIEGTGGDVVEINVTGENCVVVSNRLDGAVDDNSGTSVVDHNDETAF